MKNILKRIIVFFVCALLFSGSIVGYSDNTVKSATYANKNKVLVVYFSHTGTTKKVAKRIRKITGGTMFRIKEKNKYPSDYDQMLNVAQSEQESKARPTIKNKVKSIKKYDIILIGYPIWWGDAPMAIYSFLETYNLSGKTIIPFCTSGGTEISKSVKGIRKVCKKSKVKSGLTANDVSNKKLRKWLKKNKVIK